MKNYFLTLSLFFLILPVTAQNKKENIDPRLVGLDVKFQTLLSDWKTPGFAVAVVEKNKVIYAKGFGYRDYENKIPVTPNTLFAIGSCTKAFTSSLMGILADDHKIDLNDSPEKYLPELNFFNQDMDNSITIKDMMCHRTGLPRHDESWFFFPTDSKDSLIRRIKFLEPSAGVREKYQYNNFMFMLQGSIVERITGKSWEYNITEKFFQPLGISRSNLSIESLEKSEDSAFGYTLKNDTIIEKTDYYPIRAMSPAGSINSSANDMAKWVITWINGGKYNGKVIIPSLYVSEAISSQMVASSGLPSKEQPDLFFSNYGYGWGLSSYRGHYRVQHTGGINGFTALTCFFPTDSVGIIILLNQDISNIYAVIRNMVADKMFKLDEKDWNKYLLAEKEKTLKSQKESESKAILNRKSGTSTSQRLSAFSGNYFNPGYGTIKVILEGDSLFAITPMYKFWLKHYHYDIFQPFWLSNNGIDPSEYTEIRYNFDTNDLGEIETIKINMEPTVDAIKFRRQLDNTTLTK